MAGVIRVLFLLMILGLVLNGMAKKQQKRNPDKETGSQIESSSTSEIKDASEQSHGMTKKRTRRRVPKRWRRFWRRKCRKIWKKMNCPPVECPTTTCPPCPQQETSTPPVTTKTTTPPVTTVPTTTPPVTTIPTTTSTEPPSSPGSLLITLSVFSGRPDPKWTISQENPRYGEFYSQLQAYDQNTTLPSFLGYRGFTIQEISDNNNTMRTWAVEQGSDLEESLLLSGLDSMESSVTGIVNLLLCQLTESDVYCATPPPEIVATTTPATTTPPQTTTPPTTQRPTTTTEAATTTEEECECPTYEPNKWNGIKNVNSNNCYNYGTNELNGQYAQPGFGAGDMYDTLTAAEVKAAAERDGLKDLGDPGKGKFPDTDDCLVALFFKDAANEDDRDFHWYRLDEGNGWSHKMASSPATNMHNGQIIQDPREIDNGAKGAKGKKLGMYEFVCFMSYCLKSDLTIGGNGP